MRYDIKQDYETGEYLVVDTKNRNAPLWGERYADRMEAVKRAKQLDGGR